jgi:general secretion pathway protein H
MIEVMIVLAISALLILGVSTGLGAGRQAEVSRATNQLANTIRFAFNKARVTGSYYRLMINIDEGAFTMQRGDDRMYLPATDRYGRVKAIDPTREKEKEERDKRAEENYNRSLQARVMAAVKGPSAGMAGSPAAMGKAGAPGVGGAAPAPAKAPAPGQPGQPATAAKPGTTTTTSPGMLDKYTVQPKKVPRRKPPIFGAFDDDNSLSELKKPFKLPKTVKVVSVRTADDLKPTTKGEASIYFFPQGHTQLAHIQIEEVEHPENAFTIIVQPLTGRVEVKEGKLDLALPDDPSAVKDDLGRKQSKRSF